MRIWEYKNHFLKLVFTRLAILCLQRKDKHKVHVPNDGEIASDIAQWAFIARNGMEKAPKSIVQFRNFNNNNL